MREYDDPISRKEMNKFDFPDKNGIYPSQRELERLVKAERARAEQEEWSKQFEGNEGYVDYGDYCQQHEYDNEAYSAEAYSAWEDNAYAGDYDEDIVGNIEFLNPESRIQQICEERDITTLVHFTRIENLWSILREGLLGRETLEKRLQEGSLQLQKLFINDYNRWDKHKEAVCVSISFPNYKMFYRIRKEKKAQEANDSQWVILLLDVKVLWQLDCAFCQRNAAHKAVTKIRLEDRKKPEALKGMFEDFYNIRHQDLSIPQDYPTHPQAEVLVFDPIPVRYIKAIHFWDAAAQEKWLPNNTGANYETSCTNNHYFEPRCDYEVWTPANFDNEGVPYTPENNVDDIPLSDAIDEDDILF